MSLRAPGPQSGAGRGPSWLGTLVVAIAVIVICLRAASQLRRSLAPAASGAPAPSSAP